MTIKEVECHYCKNPIRVALPQMFSPAGWDELQTKVKYLKEENEKLKQAIESIAFSPNPNKVIAQRLKEENERLKRNCEPCSCKKKSTEDEITGWMDCNCGWCKTIRSPELIKFLDRKVEIKQQLEQEIKKLKAENEKLTECIYTISMSEKPNVEAAKEVMKQNEKLRQENQQLKAQLQNREKASQVEQCEVSGAKLGKSERKPHRCQRCYGFALNCASCNGTGIVWEKK